MDWRNVQCFGWTGRIRRDGEGFLGIFRTWGYKGGLVREGRCYDNSHDDYILRDSCSQYSVQPLSCAYCNR